MAFFAKPMFEGDLYDTSLRLAASPERESLHPPGSPFSSTKWRQMLDMGWQGVIVPESAGGVGATLADLAAIVEAAARHALAAPLIDRCAVGPSVLAPLAAQPQVRDLLEAVAVGDASVATVLDASARLPGASGDVRLGDGQTLHGVLRDLDLNEPATHVVFNLVDAVSGQPLLALLPTDVLLPRARHFRGVDGRASADVPLDGLQLAPQQVLLRGPAVLDAVARAQQVGSLLSCAQAVGAAGAMIEQTIAYLGTRVQFGVALATFQALRHRVVEMYVAFENASGLVRRLIEQATPEAVGDTRDLALAKLYVGRVARQVSELAIQLHGGMGMTWETLVARLAMHSLMGSTQYGDTSQCTDWLTAHSVAQAQASQPVAEPVH